MSDNKEEKESRGIPEAKFIESVVDYVQQSKLSADAILQQLQTLYGKYKFMESHLVQQQKSLLVKIPDITAALEALRYIMAREDPIKAQFELADSVYASASIAPANTVALWLGANVMLEYSYDEAAALLEKNLKNAQLSLDSLEKDLTFLKDQITISEVNIARIHNYNVTLKKSQNISTQGKMKQVASIPA